jgi:hypothetical protein
MHDEVLSERRLAVEGHGERPLSGGVFFGVGAVVPSVVPVAGIIK